jgi:hypothetical protein
MISACVFLPAPQGSALCCGGICRGSSIASSLLPLSTGLKSNFRHPLEEGEGFGLFELESGYRGFWRW